MNLSRSYGSGNYKFLHWNNWRTSLQKNSNGKNNAESETDSECESELFTYESGINSRFRNWIPPVSWRKKKRSCRKNQKSENKEKICKYNSCEEKENKIEKSKQVDNKRSKVKLDWHERQMLYNVTNPSYEDLIWTVVSLGVFKHIKLWINNYGNLCGYAEGTIRAFETSKRAVISITNTDLLRKMLNVPTPQWSALCEIISENKSCLTFNAFKDANLKIANSTEKAWFFLCRRRHVFPDQCMLVKYSGAMKSIQELAVIPKYTVQDVRDIEGCPIV